MNAKAILSSLLFAAISTSTFAQAKIEFTSQTGSVSEAELAVLKEKTSIDFLKKWAEISKVQILLVHADNDKTVFSDLNGDGFFSEKLKGIAGVLEIAPYLLIDEPGKHRFLAINKSIDLLNLRVHFIRFLMSEALGNPKQKLTSEKGVAELPVDIAVRLDEMSTVVDMLKAKEKMDNAPDREKVKAEREFNDSVFSASLVSIRRLELINLKLLESTQVVLESYSTQKYSAEDVVAYDLNFHSRRKEFVTLFENLKELMVITSLKPANPRQAELEKAIEDLNKIAKKYNSLSERHEKWSDDVFEKDEAAKQILEKLINDAEAAEKQEPARRQAPKF